MQKTLYWIFKCLEFLSPKAASYLIDYQMRSPRKLKRRAKEEKYLSQAQKRVFPYKNFQIQEFRWGNVNAPVVLCIHGWEGNAGNFGSFSSVFTTMGYQMIALDGPAHGESSRGKIHMFEYIDFVTQQVERIQPEIIVSHSFGSVCTVFSMLRLKNLNLKKWIAVTTPNAFRDYLNHMLKPFHVKNTTKKALIQRIEKRVEFPFEELDMAHTHKYVEQFPKTAIFHSKADTIIPFWQAENAANAIPGVYFYTLEKVGHYKILWNKELLSQVVTWLKS